MYKKFSAGHIFTGYQLMGAGNVLITDKEGKIVELVQEKDAGDGVQYFDGIISPGFINTHCHLELSHMKGRIPEKTGLVDFVFRIIGERHFSEEEIVAAIEKADQEMYNNGIAAVGDICNTAFTIPQKQKSRLAYYNFIETAGFPPAAAASRFEKNVALYKQYKASLPFQSIVPHAPYSVSPALFSLIDSFAENKVLSIHNQETAAENEFFENGTGDFTRLYEKLGLDISFFKPSGTTSLQTFLPYLKQYQALILVHNVLTDPGDIAFQKSHSSKIIPSPVFYCLCPNANLYITGSLPAVNDFIKEGCTMVLGTDSLASNHQLSILEEMKTLQKNFPGLPTTTLLQWATINGARALQLDDQSGSFEKGKQPGIVLIENVEGGILTGLSSAKRLC